ncbi:response regulator [Sphingopyxis sp. YF1]|uniref:response regulator n=1 Tax=Sphingopyxis sp. YF1 TaxID=2482763 RepID=UPI001F6201CC|nr:response regulator [Sphingopyxis sp. YF1]UNU45037.1 response regulator [Sphingopyxis sp. YF1]
MLFASRPSCIKRLLVIEDDPLVAFDNERTLLHGGYEVIATVDSGEAAVPVMASEAIDALVLDLTLAGDMTGRDVARLARDRGIAVLLVTGAPPADAGEIALACLAKPHSASALVSALKAIETMICQQKPPRKVSGLETYWRPEAA